MIAAAFLLGLTGSLHCLGMCGPLVVTATAARKPIVLNKILYNAGRIFTYGILGAAVSSVGHLFAAVGFADSLSILLGSALIILGFFGVTQLRIPIISAGMLQLSTFLKNAFARVLSMRGAVAFTSMGMINGLLPCGLTYLALAYCVGASSALEAFTFMIMFGAGTLPVMLGLSSVFQTVLNYFNFSFRKMATLAMIGIGVLLIVRGMQSPHVSHHTVSEGAITTCP